MSQPNGDSNAPPVPLDRLDAALVEHNAGDREPLAWPPSPRIADAVRVILATVSPTDVRRYLSPPMRVVIDVVARQLDVLGSATRESVDHLTFLFHELADRVEELERSGRISAQELGVRFDQPALRRTIADATGTMLGGDRPEIGMVLADLVIAKALAPNDVAEARFTTRAVRVLDEISTEQLLLTALVAFLVPAQTTHTTSEHVHTALMASNLAAYDTWLSKILKRLVPRDGVKRDDLDDLLSVGLLAPAAHASSPGESPAHGSAIDGVLARYGLINQDPSAEPDPRSATIRFARHLLQPTEAGGIRLAADEPILEAYWPTPLGFRLAQPLLSRFTDLGTRVDEGDET